MGILGGWTTFKCIPWMIATFLGVNEICEMMGTGDIWQCKCDSVGKPLNTTETANRYRRLALRDTLQLNFTWKLHYEDHLRISSISNWKYWLLNFLIKIKATIIEVKTLSTFLKIFSNDIYDSIKKGHLIIRFANLCG